MATTKDPLSGHPGHLDEHQTQTLEAFRSELTSAGLIPENRDIMTKELGYDRYDDQTLLRFLRARKFDIPKARLMWENNEKWRKEFGTDEIAAFPCCPVFDNLHSPRPALYSLSHPQSRSNVAILRCSSLARCHRHGFDYHEGPEVNKYYPQFYHRIDREGRPIYIERLGAIDVAKIGALTNQDRQLKHLVDEYEKFLKDRLPACSKEKGELVETSCTILDLHNAGISSFYRVKDYVSAASAIGQNHSRNYGTHVHHQCPLPILHHLVPYQTLAR
ncbi:sec14 cytosolic factor [Kockovaella imperatae]|uniref:Sec14 cytosolic factor n=1 Tax=Kockovaella imperatae TaxID=4999 RepID=A0A1Y1UFU5_9TREE|nr:sec14 cytosolic factor [Kockovaella imperatae]ORX36940.1 sec14 cytosolic factor [Kockovaella imperatae]